MMQLSSDGKYVLRLCNLNHILKSKLYILTKSTVEREIFAR